MAASPAPGRRTRRTGPARSRCSRWTMPPRRSLRFRGETTVACVFRGAPVSPPTGSARRWLPPARPHVAFTSPGLDAVVGNFVLTCHTARGLSLDDRAFDSFARALAGTSTRRAALAGALASLLPLAGAARRKHGPDAVACLPNGQRCGKGSGRHGKPCARCCSRFSIAQGNGKRRCSCRPAGTPAANAAQCCAGRRSAGGYCGACDPGLTACAAGCVDTETDATNCGACGHACLPDLACAGGACVACVNDAGCGDDQACCGGACVDPATDHANCGGCGTACGATQVCDRGTCVTGRGTCAEGANACLGAPGSCDGNPDCFCIPTRAGATRCARYYTHGGGFLRPCAADADCADLGPGSFCPPQFDSCGGVCSMPC